MSTDWEIAREKLTKEIVAGRIPEEWAASKVRLLDPDYAKAPKDNFTNNLRALRKRLAKHKEWADKDQDALNKDRVLHPIDLVGRWPGSEAEKLLKSAIANGDHLTMKPKALYEDKVAYQMFTLDQFRKHIDQELRSGRESLYWLVYKDKKKKTRQENQLKKEAKAAIIAADPLQCHTVKELNEMLRVQRLSTQGKKQELIQRLKDDKVG
jgi:hypothetical protein